MSRSANRYGLSGNLAFADRAVHHAVIRAVLCAGRLHAVFLDRFAGRMSRSANRYGLSGNLAFADRAVHHAVIRAVLCAGRLHAVFLDRFAGRMPHGACKITDDRFFARAADIRRISALLTGGCGHDALTGVYAVHRKVRVFGRKRHQLRRIDVLIPHCTQTLIVLEKRNLNGSVGSTDRLGLKSDLRQHACGIGYIGVIMRIEGEIGVAF